MRVLKAITKTNASSTLILSGGHLHRGLSGIPDGQVVEDDERDYGVRCQLDRRWPEALPERKYTFPLHQLTCLQPSKGQHPGVFNLGHAWTIIYTAQV